MPNLVGIFDPQASPEELERDLRKMMEAVDLPAFNLIHRSKIEPGVAVGNVLPGRADNLSQPAIHKAENIWLMIDGELLDLEYLKRSLRAAGHDDVEGDDAQLALAAYLAFGERFVDYLRGTWNIFVFDGRNKTCFLVTDRIGTRLLFAAQDGDRLVFSNEMKAVVAGRKKPSKAGGYGLFQLLIGNGHVGKYTWIDGVELVEPGTIMTLTPGRRRAERYWRMRFQEGGPIMSEDAYAEGFAERMRAATERCFKQSDTFPVGITLSGGLDSRAIALSIDKRHLPMPAITYGEETSPDVIFARQLAGVIGLDHHFIEGMWPQLVAEGEKVYEQLEGRKSKRSYFSVQLERIAWRSEALTLFDGLASMVWHPFYQKHMRIMFNGAAGDAMTGSHLSPGLLLAPSREKVMQGLMGAFHYQDDALVRQVMNPDFYRRYAPEKERRFAESFAEIDVDEALAVSNVWDMENRQRRGAFTSFTMERYFCTCRTPFVDYDLVDFLTSVPGRWRFQQRIYKRMIVQHYPEAAHVPWAYTRGKITTSPTYEFAREVFNFVKNRVKERLPGSSAPHWEFRDSVKMMSEDMELAREVEAFTRADYFPSEALTAEGVRRLVTDYHREKDSSRAFMCAHMCGLAKCIEFFIAPSEIRMPPLADPASFGVVADAELKS